MESIFSWTRENPYHVSVGVILRRKNGDICCHHFGDIPENPIKPEGVYILMRESLHPNESLEAAADRGLMEEFGATGTPVRFIGTLFTKHREPVVDVVVEKAVHYLLYDFVSQDISLRQNIDLEGKSLVEWLPLETLIENIEKQHPLLKRDDCYETPILKRLL